MATVTLYPRTSGTNTNWSDGAGTLITSVQTNDGATSYRYAVNDGTVGRLDDEYFLDTMPATDGSACTCVPNGVMGRNGTSAGTFKFMNRTGTTVTLDPSGGGGYTAPASWNLVTSSGSWSLTETNINAYVFGFRNWDDSGTSGRRVYATQYYLGVTYTAAPTGYSFVSCFLPFIGALTLPSMVQGLVRAGINRFVTYTEEELEKVKEEVRKAQRGYSFGLDLSPKMLYNYRCGNHLGGS